MDVCGRSQLFEKDEPTIDRSMAVDWTYKHASTISIGSNAGSAMKESFPGRGFRPILIVPHRFHWLSVPLSCPSRGR